MVLHGGDAVKLIHGPEDVAVGDLVRFEVGNHRRRGHMEGCVTAVHDESVSVRVEGEPRVRVLRMWKEKRGSGMDRTKYREHLLRVVAPCDLWRREQPSGFDLEQASVIRKQDTATIPIAQLIAMTPEDASAKLCAFIEWLKRRPS